MTNKRLCLFTGKKLCRLLRERRKEKSLSELARENGLSPSIVNRWAAGDIKSPHWDSGQKMYDLLGDDIFTHRLDLKKFHQRQEAEIEKFGQDFLAADDFGVSHETFRAWRLGVNKPGLDLDRYIYSRYGRSVFTRMEGKKKDSWLARVLDNLTRRIRG